MKISSLTNDNEMGCRQRADGFSAMSIINESIIHSQ